MKNKFHAQTCLGYIGGANSLEEVEKIAKEYLDKQKLDISVSIYSEGKFVKYVEKN
jgi:hypothetical protein